MREANDIVGNRSFACCVPECCASGQEVMQPSEEQHERRHLDIEFLYLDLSVCTRCQETENSLEGVLSEVAGLLEPAGVEVTLQRYTYRARSRPVSWDS